ncbi:DNA-binding response regulator [Rhodohalobacter sp. SW132]|uniref:response regulator n=1 Tax=Rhodohalobacter sp. SW132 TaxID=2293433 RepID=UPI000E243AF2|nr:response regulator transcription factor [Rhodohalobacter sp. SW132]REL38891.1 DNA-binding response regulator [Rhodohalobacter sp. SW132]
MSKELIKVSIIEDNAYMREGWETFIDFEKDMCVVGSFDSCEKAFEDSEFQKSDLVLLDINLPGMDGIEGLDHIRKKDPEKIVIMVTVHDDDDHIFAALKAGAVGYLMKKVTPDELVDAVRDAYKGGSPITPNIARKVIQTFHRSEKLEEELSDREREILTELARGLSYAAIGKKIFLSVDGIRHHIRNIYRKLEVNSKSEAVAKGLKNRLIDL